MAGEGRIRQDRASKPAAAWLLTEGRAHPETHDDISGQRRMLLEQMDRLPCYYRENVRICWIIHIFC